jgi:hypothetical protein
MSSFILLLAAVAIVSVFKNMGAMTWFVEQSHLILTIFLSLVVVATYALNLAIIDLHKDTGLKPVETGFSAVLVGVAGLAIIYAAVRIWSTYGGAGGKALAMENMSSIRNMLGSNRTAGYNKTVRAKPPPEINPLNELSSLIHEEND